MPLLPTPSDVTDSTTAFHPTDARNFWKTQLRSRMLAIDACIARDHSAITDDVRATIDTEILEIANILSLVKMRRNDTACVNCLPAEVLTHIFAILVDVDPPMNPSLRESKPDVVHKHLGWIRVTHVCMSWRQRALACAGLWNNVVAGLTPKWMMELINRSNPMPLMFDMPITAPGEWHRVRSVVEMVSTPAVTLRLKRFHVEGLLPQCMGGLLSMLAHQAPILEDLELREILTHSQTDTAGPGPRTVFSSEMPQLRRLALQGWWPSYWDMPYLCDLTSLEIVNSKDAWRVHHIPIPDCLEMLGRSPQLESVIFKDIFCKGYEYTGPRVILDHLSRLSLQCNIPGLILLLSNLQFPNTSIVEISFGTSYVGLSELLTLVVPYSRTGIKRPSLAYCDMLTVTFHRPSGGRLHRFRRISCRGQSPDCPKLSMEYEDLNDATHQTESSRKILEICKHIETLHAVVALTLGGNDLGSLEKATLHDVLRGMPTLSCLVLEGQETISAVDLLRETTGSAMDVKACPRLERLELRDACLGFRDTRTSWPMLYGPFLLEALQTRRALGVPVDTLTMLRCTFQEGMLEQLQAYVSVLNCHACESRKHVSPPPNQEPDNSEGLDTVNDQESWV